MLIASLYKQIPRLIPTIKHKTIIIISHTLDLVKDCDNIFYLENGIIEEQGTHEQLIEKGERYYNLIENSL